MTKPLVIYHANCTDGFGAAFAAWMKLGDGAEYVPMQYGADYSKSENTFEVHGREIYILDFSFPRDIMDMLFAKAKRVVWLDHHKTAFEMWCGKYEKGMRVHENVGNPDVHELILDDNKSGALLAWEWFHGHKDVPMLIQHIDDRDRWVWALDGSAELHAALGAMQPWSFEKWPDVFELASDRGMLDLYTEGAAILRAQKQHVERMAKQAQKCRIIKTESKPDGEHWEANVLVDASGLAVNASLHQSEVGHELANQSGTFGCVWYVGADNRVQCSLRSNGEYDVSAVARAFGGGGHRNAAGFETDIETLMSWLT